VVACVPHAAPAHLHARAVSSCSNCFEQLRTRWLGSGLTRFDPRMRSRHPFCASCSRVDLVGLEGTQPARDNPQSANGQRLVVSYCTVSHVIATGCAQLPVQTRLGRRLVWLVWLTWLIRLIGAIWAHVLQLVLSASPSFSATCGTARHGETLTLQS